MTPRELEQLRVTAENAMERLKRYRQLYKQGTISLEVVKTLAKYPIEVYDSYTKVKSKQHNVRFKRFSLAAFLR